MGVQLRDGYRQNRRGQVFYYDQNGVLNANGKQDPKPDNNNNNTSGRNQFVQIGNNVWAYYDGNGKRVTGHQTSMVKNSSSITMVSKLKGVLLTRMEQSVTMMQTQVKWLATVLLKLNQVFGLTSIMIGAAVKGSQNINGQNLYFDQNGRQVKRCFGLMIDGNLRLL